MRFVLAVAVLSIPAVAAWGQMPGGAIADEPPGGVANAAHAVLSPPARTTVKFGRSAISVAYSAPSRRKRVIFGVLEPYNKVWRAGANNATALHTDADLTMEVSRFRKAITRCSSGSTRNNGSSSSTNRPGKRDSSTTASRIWAGFL
jgi:Protein of unknown function (DUF2911)